MSAPVSSETEPLEKISEFHPEDHGYILEKTTCCSETDKEIIDKEIIFNRKIVIYIINILSNMKLTPKELNIEGDLKKINDYITEFFNVERFKNINEWCLYCTGLRIDNHLLIANMKWGGSHRCQFKDELDEIYDGYKFGSDDFILYNLENKEIIILNSLHLHSIYYHNYFGDSIYNINKEQLLKVINKTPQIKNISGYTYKDKFYSCK